MLFKKICSFEEGVKKSSKYKIVNMIATIWSIVAFVLIMVSIWGDAMYMDGPGFSFGISSFCGLGWRYIESSGGPLGTVGSLIVYGVIGLLFFIINLLICLFSSKGIIVAFKNLANSEDCETFPGLIMLSVVSSCFLGISSGLSSLIFNNINSIKLGWGLILAIVILVLNIAMLIVYLTFAFKTANNICENEEEELLIKIPAIFQNEKMPRFIGKILLIVSSVISCISISFIALSFSDNVNGVSSSYGFASVGLILQIISLSVAFINGIVALIVAFTNYPERNRKLLILPSISLFASALVCITNGGMINLAYPIEGTVSIGIFLFYLFNTIAFSLFYTNHSIVNRD